MPKKFEEQLRKEAREARLKTIKASEQVETAKIEFGKADDKYRQALEEERGAWDRLLKTSFSAE